MIPDNVTWFSDISHLLAEKLQKSAGSQPPTVRLLHIDRLTGGDIHETYRLHTNAGNYFLKTNTHPDAYRMFACEYRALERIHQTRTIRVPEPIAYHQANGRAFLLMEFLEKGKPIPRFWDLFAEQLAQLHEVSNPLYGFDEDNFIGLLPQPNPRMMHWPEFFAEARIGPLVRQAFDEQLIDISDLRLAESLMQKLPELLPDDRASLLHGDLWGGNFMVSNNGMPAVYDPASYFGHREMDIAMADLFGGFDRRFFETYATLARLEQGWRHRLRLHQLYYLLVHLLLFGRSYYHQVKDILETYA
ncbi:fructosamine kinase family protein [Thermoflavifilum thermophilum]|uniref:Fructosamine-3-kinase n=1 Tax=Thermoflavifilum thermophilum TaxID=1393122 RepID=A0A1I7NLK5_9BACT|nr:fructosamine kinase family protein [Thermoflavifilum thermophilum]SFV35527.1 Fructosamine-3-kinase [Thermoflavifilum thermophilum]